jgi:hypothetical protein
MTPWGAPFRASGIVSSGTSPNLMAQMQPHRLINICRLGWGICSGGLPHGSLDEEARTVIDKADAQREDRGIADELTGRKSAEAGGPKG